MGGAAVLTLSRDVTLASATRLGAVFEGVSARLALRKRRLASSVSRNVYSPGEKRALSRFTSVHANEPCSAREGDKSYLRSTFEVGFGSWNHQRYEEKGTVKVITGTEACFFFVCLIKRSLECRNSRRRP